MRLCVTAILALCASLAQAADITVQVTGAPADGALVMQVKVST